MALPKRSLAIWDKWIVLVYVLYSQEIYLYIGLSLTELDWNTRMQGQYRTFVFGCCMQFEINKLAIYRQYDHDMETAGHWRM